MRGGTSAGQEQGRGASPPLIRARCNRAPLGPATVMLRGAGRPPGRRRLPPQRDSSGRQRREKELSQRGLDNGFVAFSFCWSRLAPSGSRQAGPDDEPVPTLPAIPPIGNTNTPTAVSVDISHLDVNTVLAICQHQEGEITAPASAALRRPAPRTAAGSRPPEGRRSDVGSFWPSFSAGSED